MTDTERLYLINDRSNELIDLGLYKLHGNYIYNEKLQEICNKLNIMNPTYIRLQKYDLHELSVLMNYNQRMRLVNHFTNCRNSGSFKRYHHCGEYLSQDHFNQSNICNDCIEEDYVCCFTCSQSITIDTASLVNNRYYCEECFSEHFVYCCNCNDPIDISNSIYQNDDYWCDICFNESFTQCEHCENYHYYDSECPHCDKYSLLPYNAKISDILHKERYNETCFGLEIELNIDEKDNLQYAIRYTKDHISIPHIWKQDGSLSNGGELVLAPCDRERLSSLNWRTILKDLRNLGCRGYDSGECGIHIHVSKTEFNHLSSDEFNALILDFLLSQRPFLKPFSQRKKFNYCELPEDFCDIQWLLNSRYRAINVLPTNTYEFRIYRSTTDYQRFYASLQFTFLAHKYLVYQARNKTSNLHLKDYLLQNKNEHKPIFDYLIKSDLINLLDRNFTRNHFNIERKKYYVRYISYHQQSNAQTLRA